MSAIIAIFLFIRLRKTGIKTPEKKSEQASMDIAAPDLKLETIKDIVPEKTLTEVAEPEMEDAVGKELPSEKISIPEKVELKLEDTFPVVEKKKESKKKKPAKKEPEKEVTAFTETVSIPEKVELKLEDTLPEVPEKKVGRKKKPFKKGKETIEEPKTTKKKTEKKPKKEKK